MGTSRGQTTTNDRPERHRRRGRPPGGGWKPAEARQELVAATKRCFAGVGVAETTIAAVADEAGVSPATVYRYFGSKDELLDAVLVDTTVQVSLTLDDLVHEAESLDGLLVESMVQIVDLLGHDPLIASMFRGSERVAAGVAASRSTEIWSIALAAGHEVVDRRPDLIAQLRRGLSVDDAVGHLMNTGLSFIVTDSPLVDDPEALRDHLVAFVLPALLEVRPDVPQDLANRSASERRIP